MASGEILVLQLLLALVFILLVILKKNGARVLLAALFLLFSAALRLSIEVDAVRDFYPYYDSFLAVRHGYVSPDLLIEPYRLVLYRSVLLLGDIDSLSQITAIYYLHFTVVTLLFLWIASLRDVSFEAKLLLFLAFYPAIAFVWIRAGMAYMAACYLLYTFTQGRGRLLHLVLPVFHVSTIPILAVIWIKGLRPLQKGIIIAAIVALALLALETNYANYVLLKWNAYTDSADERTSTNLLLLHLFNIAIFVYFAVINVEFRKNFAILVLMAMYLVFYWFNPVMGLRVFPFVPIACIVQRIYFHGYKGLTLGLILALCPVYLYRFDQIML